LILALGFGLLALMRDAFLVWGYRYSISPDSIGYIALGEILLNRSLPLSSAALGEQALAFDATSLNTRTLPYPLMNALAHPASSPLGLVWAQIAIGSAAVAALVYVVSRRDRLLGIVSGALLALNPLWGALNRTVLTEGLFTSFHVLSLAILLHHFHRRERASSWGLPLAGVLYGWTFTFRPTGLPLLILMPILYLWITRSWRKAGWVLAGGLAVVLASGSFYWWRTGQYRLFGEGGIYSAFPLFTHHLFSAENGPVSSRIDEGLRACDGLVEYSAFTRNERNTIIKGQYIPCLQSQGWSEAEIADQFGEAYREGVLSHPTAFAAAVAYDNALFLTYPVMEGLPEQLEPLIGRCLGYDWCETVTDTRLPHDGEVSQLIVSVASYPTQLYRLLGPRAGGDQTVADLFAWLILIGLLILSTRGSARFLTLVCAAFVHYLSLAVSVGFIYLPRYTYVLSPFHELLSALLLLTLIRAFVPRRAGIATGPDQSTPQRTG
jgi:4-amino-4-deoxy-L-arabinose transferase-like glycosyltransferase